MQDFLHEFDFAQIQEMSRDCIWLMESCGFMLDSNLTHLTTQAG
jgi:hypothetical protein